MFEQFGRHTSGYPSRVYSCTSLFPQATRGLFVAALVLASCGDSSTSSVCATDAGCVGNSACSSSGGLVGATYDIKKSRFSFGSAPAQEESTAMVRWIGSDGVAGIYACGKEMGVANATAAGASLPDWSSSPSVLSELVFQYFASMGMEECQIGDSAVLNGTVSISRSVDGIAVVESNAFARFNSKGETTSEGLYWPAVSAATVVAAMDFRQMLSDPVALAAYKAKLPSGAQGVGRVSIHHSTCTLAASPSEVIAAATYDVIQSGEMSVTLSFDVNGNAVETSW